MQLETLNNTYYGLFEQLTKARRFLTDKQFDIMEKVLRQQYLEDLDISLTEKFLEFGVNHFELKFKSRVYVPRRGLFGYNKMAKHLLKMYKSEFLTELKRLELSVKEEKDIHKEIDKEIEKPAETQSTALTVAENKVAVVTEENYDGANS